MNQRQGQLFWSVIPFVPPFLLGCIFALLCRSCSEEQPEESPVAASTHAEATEPPIEIPNESLWAIEACIQTCSTRGGAPVISPPTRPQGSGWRCLCDLTEPQE